MWTQIVPPNTNVNEWAGSCLGFARLVFNAPPVYPSAWKGWMGAQFKHENRDFPQGMSFPLWFEHWGTYGEEGHEYYDNWGHVVVLLADGTIISSPGSGYGQARFSSISSVEAYFNCKYVGWSEDINGVRVVEGSGQSGDDEVKQLSFNGRRYLIGMGAIQSIPVGEDVGDMYGQPIDLGTNFERGDAMNRVCRAHGIPDWAWQQVGNGSDVAGNDHTWTAATGFYLTTAGPTNHQANVDMDAIKQAIKDAIGSVDVNVDAIASAIADKLDLTCDCGCGVPKPEPVPDTTTKAEILSSIEANYPEDK